MLVSSIPIKEIMRIFKNIIKSLYAILTPNHNNSLPQHLSGFLLRLDTGVCPHRTATLVYAEYREGYREPPPHQPAAGVRKYCQQTRIKFSETLPPCGNRKYNMYHFL